jgi:hypothetical protein
MNKEEEVDRRINNSVRWLNTVDPDWLNKVNTITLDMTRNCILDQVFGNYEDVIKAYPVLQDKKLSKLYCFAGHTQKWKEKINTLKNEVLQYE